MEDNVFWFEVPINYSMASQSHHIPSADLIKSMEKEIPDCVASAIFDSLPMEVPLEPLQVFYRLKIGLVPAFAVIWMMRHQERHRRGPRLSNMAKFYKALHLITALREGAFFSDPLPLSGPGPEPETIVID